MCIEDIQGQMQEICLSNFSFKEDFLESWLVKNLFK